MHYGASCSIALTAGSASPITSDSEPGRIVLALISMNGDLYDTAA